MSPEVVPGAEEEDRELSDLVTKVLDIGGDVSGVVDLCRPPSEEGGREQVGDTHSRRAAESQRAASLTCTFPA